MRSHVILVILFLFIFNVRQHGQNNSEFVQIKSEAKATGQYQVRITSDVVVQEMSDLLKMAIDDKYGEIIPADDLSVIMREQFFHYQIHINNGEIGFVRINLPGIFRSYSCAIQILNDYSIILGPGEDKWITFVSNRKPIIVSTTINLGHRSLKGYSGGWNFVSAGITQVYSPPESFSICIPTPLPRPN